MVRYCPRKRLLEHTCLLVAFVSAAVILYSADGSVEDAKYALGNLLGRLQVWLREIRSMRVSAGILPTKWCV